MPVENEFNYLLDAAGRALENRLRDLPGVRRLDMRQGYLGEDIRLRAFHDLDTGELSYVFSFKRKVAGESIEVETPTNEDDFRKLYAECHTKLRKTRYAFVEDGVHWDVDFLRTKSGKTYFAKAEAEVGPEVTEPPEPCASLAASVLAIPGKAKGFSSRRLADEAYAGKLLARLLEARRGRERRGEAEARRPLRGIFGQREEWGDGTILVRGMSLWMK